jgi:hypothetical protein
MVECTLNAAARSRSLACREHTSRRRRNAAEWQENLALADQLDFEADEIESLAEDAKGLSLLRQDEIRRLGLVVDPTQ